MGFIVFFHKRFLSGIDQCPVSVVTSWVFFSNFHTNSELQCDTLARISGGSAGTKGFCLRVNFDTPPPKMPKRTFFGRKLPQKCIPRTCPLLKIEASSKGNKAKPVSV